jgi:diguanylate cyclase (GGDEF)-like protein
MIISDLCGRVRRIGPARWELWRLPGRVQGYILGVHAAALAALIVAAVSTHWTLRDIAVFAALAFCDAATIEATRKRKAVLGSVFRDMQTVWYIATFALLPPVYVFLLAIVLAPVQLLRMARGVAHRRAFSGSACALAYGAAGVAFDRLPHTLAGPYPGSGPHVVSWLVALTCCGTLGLAINNVLVIGAIKLSDPAARFRKHAFELEALVTDVCQLNIAVLIALPAAFSPVLLAAALPVVVILRRVTMHAQLVAAARIDSKTGLLNAATWQQEAALEVARAMRVRSPLAIALADIDHFKAVNDTHGHLAGDAVLSLISATMAALLREYDVVGRFGGEEFAICLPHTSPEEALVVAERLRYKIAQITSGEPGEAPVQITISVGVASLESADRTLDELIAAADAALYRAKAAGRNCVMLSREERLRAAG